MKTVTAEITFNMDSDGTVLSFSINSTRTETVKTRTLRGDFTPDSGAEWDVLKRANAALGREFKR